MAGQQVIFTKGEGCWVWDADGRRYLDATAGLWYCNVGHGRQELADVAAKQMSELAAYQTFDVFANQPALELADRVCAIAPMDSPSAAFFTNGGSDAVDTAGKIVRRYWQLSGRPDRIAIVARGGAYHGMNAYGTSLGGIEANVAGWGPLVREIKHVPHDSPAALADLLERQSETIGAFIGEPVIGAGGVYPPDDDYWPAVQDLCREYDLLLIADEVVTGFGRLGPWFGSERYGFEPDLIVAAKGLTSGYVPAGVVISGPRVIERLWSDKAGPFRHGYTYSGHPTACAIGLANLEIIEREELRDRVSGLEAKLLEHLIPLADHPMVHEVRHVGLLAGIELARNRLESDPSLADKVVRAARNENILVRNLVGRTLQISPPFVITEDEIGLMARGIGTALDAVEAGFDAGSASG